MRTPSIYRHLRTLFVPFLFVLSGNCVSQNLITVTIVTQNQIRGTAPNGTTVYIDTDGDGTQNVTITVGDTNSFTHVFVPPLTSGRYIVVWSDQNSRTAHPILTDAQALSTMLSEPVSAPPTPSSTSEVSRDIPEVDVSKANMTSIYKSTIWNTVFSIPIARINTVRDESLTEARVSLFTSFGAGFGLSWGRHKVVRNNLGKIITQEFSNTFGIYGGLLYASATGEEERNVVAPVINLNVLDFQLGVGYEAGTLAENQRRIFFTVSYSIPMYKLLNTNFRARNRDKPLVDEYSN